MKKILVVYILCLFSLSAATQQPVCKINISTAHKEIPYEVNEPVTFDISVIDDNNAPIKEGIISYKVTQDLEKVLSSGQLNLNSASLKVTEKLNKSGFLNCEVSFSHNGQTTVIRGGAAIEPLKIKPGSPTPNDFNDFWSSQLNRLRKYPAKAFLTPVESKEPRVELFEVRIDCLDWMPVAGYFARPANAISQNHPAILLLHGAGAFSARTDGVEYCAKNGFLAMEINAHGIANNQTNDFYSDLGNGSLSMSRYPYAGSKNRETCYFLGMFLRLVRATDFLASQPQWDQKRLITKGFSQGGCQAIVAAGLDPRVTMVAASAPAMCDHNGEVVGWPHLITPGPDDKPDAEISKTAGYFDVCNFAARTNARVMLSVGYVDSICRPTSVYAAYNCFKSDKEIINLPSAEHSSPQEVEDAFWKMINEYAKSK
ncbi:MAG: Acetyl esterase Axe7A precursor [Planctomycetes bacterium ADurb.Bin401]|nr:MAG: Acetyl esterase Axe7A precursor [Planctomycetes bacterium ADurb.Bin401]